MVVLPAGHRLAGKEEVIETDLAGEPLVWHAGPSTQPTRRPDSGLRVRGVDEKLEHGAAGRGPSIQVRLFWRTLSWAVTGDLPNLGDLEPDTRTRNGIEIAIPGHETCPIIVITYCGLCTRRHRAHRPPQGHQRRDSCCGSSVTSRVRLMTSRPCDIALAIGAASSSGRTSRIHISRHRRSPSATTCMEALSCSG
jgi:hypothetical protein